MYIQQTFTHTHVVYITPCANAALILFNPLPYIFVAVLLVETHKIDDTWFTWQL